MEPPDRSLSVAVALNSFGVMWPMTTMWCPVAVNLFRLRVRCGVCLHPTLAEVWGRGCFPHGAIV